jgi:hypothetical protein
MVHVVQLEVDVNDLLDISHRVLAVAVVGSGVPNPVPAFTDGQHFYFDDATVARVGAHLSGRLDLAGRPVRIERSDQGWHEQRGRHIRPLHQRSVNGEPVFRFDEEWLFSVVPEPIPAQQQNLS